MLAKIQTADLEWQFVDGIEIPISKQFGDVYFSKHNGLLETRHVFLQGNDLAERLAQLDDYEHFYVGETGFGTGLNILALWQLWQNVRPQNHSHLHVVTLEKYPLSQDDLRRALAVWQELAPLSQQLIEQYPLPIAGCHRLKFERFSIDLWLGDAVDILPKIMTNKPINAWFLDGFAPACNPDFWQDHVLNHIMRLSARGTTFASFSVAGVVKRGLAQYDGIQISRPKGFGHKREMLKAVWASQHELLKNTKHTQKIAIVGAGIAGLSCAYALAQRGHQVVIMDKKQALANASGNPLALLNPKLCAVEQADEHLMTISWQYALRHYKQFKAFHPLKIHQLQLKTEQDIRYLVDEYPDNILSITSSVDKNSPYPHLTLNLAGAVQPHLLAEQILSHQNIQLQQVNVTKIKNIDGKIHIYQQDDEVGVFNDIILCNAKQSADLVQPFPPLKAIRGQVSWCEKSNTSLDVAYSYGGYCMQLDENHMILGASFYPNREDDEVLEQDHQHNLALYQHSFVDDDLPSIDTWQGRASIRAQTADYFPLVGRVSEHIYTLSGLGSKGFLFAPLCAEVLMAEMLGEIYPIPEALYHKLSLKRFKIMR